MKEFLPILMGVGGVASVVYCLMRPQTAFVLIMVLFPLKQLLQVYVPFLGERGSLVNYGIGGLALLCVIMRLARREPTVRSYFNGSTILILAFYLYWLMGVFYSPAQESYWKTVPLSLTYQAVFFILLPLLIVNVAELRRMLYIYMVVGAVIAVLIMMNPRSGYHAGRLVLDLGMVGGGRTDKGNPLATASMGASVALIAAMLYPVRATYLVTLMRIGAFVAGMGIAIGSGSRGQVLAAGIVGIIFYPISRRLANAKQFLIVSGGFMFLVAGLYLVFKMFVGADNVERWNPATMLRDTTQRLDVVMDLFNLYASSPGSWLFGLGSGAYTVISQSTNVDVDYVHNLIAEILCEHGVFGLGMFGLIVYLFVRHTRQLWEIYRENPPMRATVALWAAFGVFATLESLKQGSLASPAPFFYWMVMSKVFKYEQQSVIESADAAEETPEPDAIDESPADGLFPSQPRPGYAIT